MYAASLLPVDFQYVSRNMDDIALQNHTFQRIKKKPQRKLATNYRDKHITFLCMLYTLWHVLFPQVFEANSVMKFKLLIQRECRLNTKTPFDKLINGII